MVNKAQAQLLNGVALNFGLSWSFHLKLSVKMVSLMT